MPAPANAATTRDILEDLLNMLNQPGAIDPGLATHVATTLSAALDHEPHNTRRLSTPRHGSR